MIEILEKFIVPGLKYLPPEMDSPQVRAMLLSIGMQESRFEHRKQVGGPAHGFWQFEQGGGVRGIITHPTTSEIARGICKRLVVPFIPAECYEAITYNDVLACCFARLLLWTLSGPLAGKGENQKAWEQYSAAWRPGKPHRESWDAYFNTAWLSLKEEL